MEIQCPHCDTQMYKSRIRKGGRYATYCPKCEEFLYVYIHQDRINNDNLCLYHGQLTTVGELNDLRRRQRQAVIREMQTRKSADNFDDGDF